MRADHLPVYGYTKVKTPAIDALARDGIVFDRAYAHSPQTLPSHAAILSGPPAVRERRPRQRWLRAQARANGRFRGCLQDAGYHERRLRQRLRASEGDGHRQRVRSLRRPVAAARRRTCRWGRSSGAAPRRWKRPSGGSPTLASPKFFLFFHIYEPHTPYTPPDRFSKYAPYDGEIAFSDEVVGQLLALAEGQGPLRPRDDHLGLRPRRRARRSRGARARPVRLRLDNPRPADREDAAAAAGGPPGEGTGPAHRPRADHPRLARAPGRKACAADRSAHCSTGRPGARQRVGLRGGALRPLSLRVERAVLAHRRALPLHQGAAGPKSTTSTAIRAKRRTSRPTGRRSSRRHGRARSHARRRDGRVADARCPRKTSSGCRRLATWARRRTSRADKPGESLPDPKDKAKVLAAYRRAIELCRKPRYDESIALLREVLADSPSMKDGWIQLGVELVRAGRNEEAVDAFKRLVETRPDRRELVRQHRRRLPVARQARPKRRRTPRWVWRRPETCARRRPRARCSSRSPSRARTCRRHAATRSRLNKPARSFPLPEYVEGLILHGDKRFEEALPHFQRAIATPPQPAVHDSRALLLHGRHAGEPWEGGRSGGCVPAGAGVLAAAPADPRQPRDALPGRRPHRAGSDENSTR